MADNDVSGGPPGTAGCSVSPYLVLHRPTELISFLKNAFDALEKVSYTSYANLLEYAELLMGNTMIRISEVTASNPAAPSNIRLTVSDVDRAFEEAIEAGGTAESEPEDKSNGERIAVVKDSTGNQ